MADTKNEIVQQRDCNSPMISDIDDDIIDVSTLDFGHPDTWLQWPSQDFMDDGILDIRAWLKNNTEQDCNDSQDNKRSIDTRTFTRPKKRLGRLSFESIVETNVPTSSNVWNQVSPSIRMKKAYKNDAEFTRHEEDSVPHMLRHSIPTASTLFSTHSTLTSGQESLEAFLNMSQSKAIDSFIDLAEPEFNEDLMETSQPSLLYSSMTSVMADDLSTTVNHLLTSNQSQISRQLGIEDSQILTESMMETSLFRDVVDVNFNDTFANLTVTNDPYASYIVDRSTSDTHNVHNFDATFEKIPASSLGKSLIKLAPEARVPASNIPTITSEVMINETFGPPSCEKVSVGLDANSELAGQKNTVPNFDATFEKLLASSPRKSSTPRAHLAANDVTTVMNEHMINETFRAFGYEKNSPKLDENSDLASQKTNVYNFDATFERTPVSSRTNDDVATMTGERVINETFRASGCEENSTKLDENSDLVSQQQNTHNCDATFKNTPASSPRKSSNKLSPEAHLTANDVPTMTGERVVNETSRAPSCEKISAKLEKNVEPVSRGGSLDNLDTTFCQPAPKIPRQLSLPRPLSWLPQSLQKSNPNLGSNTLKTSNTITRSGIPSLGFNRAVRPSSARNVESSLTSKLYGFGRMKSGSEHRLAETRNSTELQSMGTGGSTESIDSTQSAHSAPDFDDRLSVRSDGSSASYSMRTMNIDEFQKIVRMQGECLKQESTPKPGRAVLENNWVATANNLPSPILKNDPDTYGSRGSSPRSTDSTVKTSSPLLSPTESLQNLTMDMVKSNNDLIEKNKLTIPRTKTALPNKTSQASGKLQRNPSEQKTGLRPPANWISANTNRQASGIPRPASRIPAPKFIRPNTKINQGDTKK